MTIDITLNSVGNLQDTTTAQNVLSTNNATITGGFTTALNITGDQMQGTLDMNSNQVINLPAPGSADSPVRLADLTNSTITLSTWKFTPVASSALPTATGAAGTRSFVTNATATTFGSTLTGSGSTEVPVYSDGTNWRIG